MLGELGDLPGGFVKGVYRYLDYHERDKRVAVRIMASPVSQLFGFPVKNASWFGASGDLAIALLALNQPPRLKVLVSDVEYSVVRVQSGVIDDISDVVTENPHEYVL